MAGVSTTSSSWMTSDTKEPSEEKQSYRLYNTPTAGRRIHPLLAIEYTHNWQ